MTQEKKYVLITKVNKEIVAVRLFEDYDTMQRELSILKEKKEKDNAIYMDFVYYEMIREKDYWVETLPF